MCVYIYICVCVTLSTVYCPTVYQHRSWQIGVGSQLPTETWLYWLCSESMLISQKADLRSYFARPMFISQSPGNLVDFNLLQPASTGIPSRYTPREVDNILYVSRKITHHSITIWICLKMRSATIGIVGYPGNIPIVDDPL